MLFVAISMNFAVMPAAQGDCKLITHSSSECSGLYKSEVVKAGLSCHKFHMLAITDSTRLWMTRSALFDRLAG
jgi:hypothetical protein